MYDLNRLFNLKNHPRGQDDLRFKKMLKSISLDFEAHDWDDFYDLIDGEFSLVASEDFARRNSKTDVEYDCLDHSCYNALKYLRDKYQVINNFETTGRRKSDKRMNIMFVNFQDDMKAVAANMAYLVLSLSDHIEAKNKKHAVVRRLPPPEAFNP